MNIVKTQMYVCELYFQEFDEEAMFRGPPCKCNCHDLVQAPDGSGNVYIKKQEK